MVEPFSFSNCYNQENFTPRENLTAIWRTSSQIPRSVNTSFCFATTVSPGPIAKITTHDPNMTPRLSDHISKFGLVFLMHIDCLQSAFSLKKLSSSHLARLQTTTLCYNKRLGPDEKRRVQRLLAVRLFS